MGLGQYVYPRYAVHISSGQAVSIERLRARCLWYPAVGLDGRMVSGHVLYISQTLNEVLELALGVHNIFDWNAEGDAEGGEEGITHRLAPPIRANAHGSVTSLIRAVLDHTRQALPPGKRKLLTAVNQAPPKDILLRLEETLQQAGLHVLLPLYIGKEYQLFTDATEALRPVSPLMLRRTPRLSFVLLSTDTLKNEKRDSPWLREAAELMALPINVVYTPEVVRFLDDLPALRPAQNDSQLIAELLSTLQEVSGGWPDLCDRFYEMLSELADVPALRQRLRQIAASLRSAEINPARTKELLELAFSRRANLPDLANPLNLDPLSMLIAEPSLFTWEEHGRGYLDGFIGWERGLAVPRSKGTELMVRQAVAKAKQTGQAGQGGSSGSYTPIDPRVISNSGTFTPIEPAPPLGPHTVRWLHVSDFHFSDKHNAQGGTIVLESLLNTLNDMKRHPRWRGIDLVFVTGDIAQSGSDAEYRLAEDYLGRLCQVLGLARQQVFMVPGNHDVYRPRGAQLVRTLSSYDDAQAYFQPSAERLHLRKMEGFISFYNRFYASDAAANPAIPPRQVAAGLATATAELTKVREVTLGILPLNSGLFAQDDLDSGKLFVGEPLLRDGLRRIDGAHIRLAMMHHPLSDLSDIERRPIQELLQEHCNFILRGHLHDNEAGYVSSAYKQTLVLAAGAAYQGRIEVQNRALIVEAEIDLASRKCVVSPYPIRYEYSGHDRWTLDTGVFPKSYPSYLETITVGI